MTTTKTKRTLNRNDRVRTSIKFPDQTMAKQSFKEECDINTIMSKYKNTGIITHVQQVQASYGDFTSVQDYQLSLNQVIEAQDAFDNLPASLRKRFGNDPSQLMAFLSDADNKDEAIKLGLVEPSPPPPEPKPEASEKPTPATAQAKPETA